MKKRYTEEQIIRAIKRNEAGEKVEDICREMGISTGTLYNWRIKPLWFSLSPRSHEWYGWVK